MGCITTYRAFCSDTVFEIIHSDRKSFKNSNSGSEIVTEYENALGFTVVETIVSWQPKTCVNHGIQQYNLLGMYVLNSIPTNKILYPQPIDPGSKSKLDSTVKHFQSMFSLSKSTSLNDWIYFQQNLAPQNDDVQDYIV